MLNLIFIFSLFVIAFSTDNNQSISEEESFYPFKSQKEIRFNYANSSSYVIHHFNGNVVNIEGIEYFERITNYSNGKSVAYYFREDSSNNYYFDTISMTENIQIPGIIEKGYLWESTDGAWFYEITDTDAKLKTPEKSYSNLLVIRAVQIQNRDISKASEYFNYYQKGKGLIANVINGRLMTYRVENTKK